MGRVEHTRQRDIIKGTGSEQEELAPLRTERPNHHLPYLHISTESILPPGGSLPGVMAGALLIPILDYFSYGSLASAPTLGR